MTGQTPPELLGPPCPEAALYVMEWFGELSARRGPAGFGLAPITWQDLEGWQRVSGVRLRAYERDWILALDQAFRAAMADEAKLAAPKAPPPRRGRHAGSGR